MGWTAFAVALRLLSPLHVGAGGEGNLQRTRPYVTGKALWGALTARLARDWPDLQGDYARAGRQVSEELAFSYFYPARGDRVDPWPWGQTADEFRWCYIDSYASTALDHGSGGADEGSLHEVEYIAPVSRDGRPVNLLGYVFQAEGARLPWQDVLPRLQLGGERGYGWGRVEVEGIEGIPPDRVLFQMYDADPETWPPVLTAGDHGEGGTFLLAHALAIDCADAGAVRRAVAGLSGQVEPLVGRETESASGFGARLSAARIAWVPGTRVTAGIHFRIGRYGLWEGV
ncbi:MAG: CRISPR-associated protein [Anaerolineae bacterium]|nr:CRISPR-associated protein [Anaerolineae bacterium]